MSVLRKPFYKFREQVTLKMQSRGSAREETFWGSFASQITTASDCPFSCSNNRKVSVFTWEMEREIVWHRTMTAARLLLLLLHNINKNISDWKLKIFKLIISRPGAQQPVSRVSKHGRGRGQSRDTAAVKHFSWWVCFYLQMSSSGDARVARQTWAE